MIKKVSTSYKSSMDLSRSGWAHLLAAMIKKVSIEHGSIQRWLDSLTSCNNKEGQYQLLIQHGSIQKWLDSFTSCNDKEGQYQSLIQHGSIQQ
jgi:sulfur transfer protein SufE